MNNHDIFESKDEGGVTQISLDNLRKFKDSERKLLKIYIINNRNEEIICKFKFENSTYHASGFSIGYGGEGPHGLHKAILMFWPDGIEKDFWASDISKLDHKKDWVYTKKNKFQEL